MNVDNTAQKAGLKQISVQVGKWGQDPEYGNKTTVKTWTSVYSFSLI